MGYKRSRHQVYPINHHLAWCPKLGKPVLAGEVRDRLEKIMSEACWRDQLPENPAASAEESVNLEFLNSSYVNAEYKGR